MRILVMVGGVPKRETVDGLAVLIDQRMDRLRLTPGEFADRAGLTRQGLDDVRSGYKKRYAAKTIYGVAAALQWEPDWYERCLAGEAPVESGSDGPPQLGERVANVEERLSRVEDLVRQLLDEVRGAR